MKIDIDEFTIEITSKKTERGLGSLLLEFAGTPAAQALLTQITNIGESYAASKIEQNDLVEQALSIPVVKTILHAVSSCETVEEMKANVASALAYLDSLGSGNIDVDAAESETEKESPEETLTVESPEPEKKEKKHNGH